MQIIRTCIDRLWGVPYNSRQLRRIRNAVGGLVYVCICNGFTERDVRELIQSGPCSAAKIYRALGGPPRCGKCVRQVRELAREDRDTHAVTAAD